MPITLDLTLALAGAATSIDVVGHVEDLVERDPSAHTDLDQSRIAKLVLEPSAGLNQVVTLASPGVVSDSNGFFHPVGDHAQTQFSIDNQPVTDQQSRVYSNQISQDAVQSMEIITGVAPAEYGDKTSLVVHIVTKSGLDQPKPTGSVTFGYGSFASPTAEVNLGDGSHRVGNFVSVSGMRTDRFLDPPEFQALHDSGHQVSFFDRLDVRTGDTGTLHLNVQAARSDFDVPNSLDADALGQAQHQDINTFNVAPGFSQVIGLKTLFTANAYVRQDHLTYSPSPDPFADQPGTVSQDRTLRNMGFKADVAYTDGRQNLKFGGTVSATRLIENFGLGFTDPAFNSPCLGPDGSPSADTSLTSPAQCGGALTVNPAFSPNQLAFDLTRGGSPFVYNQAATIKQQAAYAQDEIKAGNATIKLGLRLDHYDGLTTATELQPRVGVSYVVGASGTVLRASYGRTMETPVQRGPAAVERRRRRGAHGHHRQPAAARDARPGRVRRAAGIRRMARRRRRLLHEAHQQRLRLQRALRDADRVPGGVGPLDDRRLHRPHQPARAPRVQRVRRDGPYQRHLFPAWRGRRAARVALRGSRLLVPDRSRSEVQRDDERAVCGQQAARDLDGAELALRFRAGGQLDRRRARLCWPSPRRSRPPPASRAAAWRRRRVRASRAATRARFRRAGSPCRRPARAIR